jgi:hypothetical protein
MIAPRARRTALTLTAGLLAAGSFLAPVSAEDLPPRPGCGYGDTNHSHQAAPGRDPLGLRPGNGFGDPNNQHTAPPGQAFDGAGDPDDPRRGCMAAPRGR